MPVPQKSLPNQVKTFILFLHLNKLITRTVINLLLIQADATACLSTLGRLLKHALQCHPHNVRLLTLSANCKMYRGDNEDTIRELLCCGGLLSGKKTIRQRDNYCVVVVSFQVHGYISLANLVSNAVRQRYHAK